MRSTCVFALENRVDDSRWSPDAPAHLPLDMMPGTPRVAKGARNFAVAPLESGSVARFPVLLGHLEVNQAAKPVRGPLARLRGRNGRQQLRNADTMGSEASKPRRARSMQRGRKVCRSSGQKLPGSVPGSRGKEVKFVKLPRANPATPRPARSVQASSLRDGRHADRPC